MQIKEGATIAGIKIEVLEILKAADKIWKAHGQELVITAGLDGTHSAGSLHYCGYAVDLRTNYFDAQTAAKVADELRKALPARYDIVLEKTHIHAEYDPR